MNRRNLLAAIIGAPFIPAKSQQVAVISRIDASGASADLLARLPEILRKNSEALEARIRERLRP